MLDHPVFIRMPTEKDEPYFRIRSAAEVVASTLINMQQSGWLRLHGFVILPEAVELVATPIKQGVAGLVAQFQAETIPLLVVLLPQAGMVWATRYVQTALTTQRALDAQLTILLLQPVAAGIVTSADQYPYSSANPRYLTRVSVYAGFGRQPVEQPQPVQASAGKDSTIGNVQPVNTAVKEVYARTATPEGDKPALPAGDKSADPKSLPPANSTTT